MSLLKTVWWEVCPHTFLSQHNVTLSSCLSCFPSEPNICEDTDSQRIEWKGRERKKTQKTWKWQKCFLLGTITFATVWIYKWFLYYIFVSHTNFLHIWKVIFNVQLNSILFSIVQSISYIFKLKMFIFRLKFTSTDSSHILTNYNYPIWVWK